MSADAGTSLAVPAQCNGANPASKTHTLELQPQSLGYFLIEAKYGSKLVVKQQLVELVDTDTFRSLLLRALKHEALKERGAELRLQVGFRLGPELISVPSADEVVSVVLRRFPDITSLQYTIQPFESDFIKIEPIRSETSRRARLFQVLGWAVRIVGAYELLLLAIRLGLRVAGVGNQPAVNTEMAENMAIAEALVNMDSEQLEEVKKLYELDSEDFQQFKEAIREEQTRRGMKQKVKRTKGSNDNAKQEQHKPWVSSGDEADSDLDGTMGKDAASDYDETAKRA